MTNRRPTPRVAADTAPLDLPVDERGLGRAQGRGVGITTTLTPGPLTRQLTISVRHENHQKHWRSSDGSA